MTVHLYFYRNFRPTAPARPIPMFSRLRPRAAQVLYYPGAGTDYGQIQHFALNLYLAVVVYLDYLIRSDIILPMPHNFTPTLPKLQRVSPRDLDCRTLADF